jgi:hypothetical protein
MVLAHATTLLWKDVSLAVNALQTGRLTLLSRAMNAMRGIRETRIHPSHWARVAAKILCVMAAVTASHGQMVIASSTVSRTTMGNPILQTSASGAMLL